jgi:cellulose biosynthesis protein BcsQ
MAAEGAGVLASHGKYVLLIDCDHQQSLTRYLSGKKKQDPQYPDAECITALFLDSDWPNARRMIHTFPMLPNIFLLPSNANLQAACNDLPVGQRAEKRLLLHDFIHEMVIPYVRERYGVNIDVALVDTPPGGPFSLEVALAACNWVFTPLEPTNLDVDELPTTQEAIQKSNAVRDRPPLGWGIVANKVQHNDHHATWETVLAREFRAYILIPPGTDRPLHVRKSAKIMDAVTDRKPLSYTKPSEDAAKDCEAVWAEAARRVGIQLGQRLNHHQKKKQLKRWAERLGATND